MSAAEPKKSGPAHESEAAGYYGTKILQTVNGQVLGAEDGERVPVVDGIAATEFDEPEEVEREMTADEKLTLEIRRACVRVFLKIDGRSLRSIASELGVTVAAVSKQWRALLARTGSGEVYLRAETRMKLARATRRTWAKKKEVSE